MRERLFVLCAKTNMLLHFTQLLKNTEVGRRRAYDTHSYMLDYTDDEDALHCTTGKTQNLNILQDSAYM